MEGGGHRTGHNENHYFVKRFIFLKNGSGFKKELVLKSTLYSSRNHNVYDTLCRLKKILCAIWLSHQSARPLVRPLKSVNYLLMNDLTRRLCEFGSRRRLLNTFTVKLTKHTVNSFESIRSRWCLVTEDGFSSDISPLGTVTPYRLSHILDWLVNRSAAVCVCVRVVAQQR